MPNRRSLLTLLVLAALAPGACGKSGPPPPTREEVKAKLDQEAQALKRDGEKMNPSLGVRSVWTIEGVDVQPRPDDESKPWKGTIRLRIDSRTQDATEVHDDVSKKTFDYLYDAGLQRWLIDVTVKK